MLHGTDPSIVQVESRRSCFGDVNEYLVHGPCRIVTYLVHPLVLVVGPSPSFAAS